MRFSLFSFLVFNFFSHSLMAFIYSHETLIIKYLKPIELSEIEVQLKCVDSIYVINLDERPEKWQRMKKLFNDIGIKINRVPGIDGSQLSQDVQRELAGPYEVRLRKGQIGCLLSHISVMKDAYERGFNTIWVLEDDVEFLEDVEQIPHLLQKLSSIDPDWDVFYTDVDSKDSQGKHVQSTTSDFRPDMIHKSRVDYRRRALMDDDIMRIRQRFGMYSFFASRKGIKKILDYFTHVYLWTAVDIDIHYIPGIREYSCTRDIVSVYDHLSDTESKQ